MLHKYAKVWIPVFLQLCVLPFTSWISAALTQSPQASPRSPTNWLLLPISGSFGGSPPQIANMVSGPLLCHTPLSTCTDTGHSCEVCVCKLTLLKNWDTSVRGYGKESKGIQIKYQTSRVVRITPPLGTVPRCIGPCSTQPSSFHSLVFPSFTRHHLPSTASPFRIAPQGQS